MEVETISEKRLKPMERAGNGGPLPSPPSWSAITEHPRKLPNILFTVTGFALVVLVGIVNHLAGPELSGWILYLIPVFLTTWFTERSIGFVISLLSALTWFVVDWMSGQTYSYSAIPYWNGLARLNSFFILTFVLSALKDALKYERELSRVDYLTGVGNRRYFIELAGLEVSRARRYKHPFTVVSIDLDNFKKVNDRLGHTTGDRLLRIVAKTIKKNIRISDTVGRIGGDEFAILLPETGPEVAAVISDKIQKVNLKVMQRHGWPVTFSVGVVTFASPPGTVDEVLKISDDMMYNAKRGGKNMIKHEVFEARDWSSVAVA